MLHDFESVLVRGLDTSCELSEFHGHGSWLVCVKRPLRATNLTVPVYITHWTSSQLPTTMLVYCYS